MSRLRTVGCSLFAVCMMLSACEHPPEWRQSVRSWIGWDADDLVRIWGIPTSSYTFKDGTKRMDYSQHSVTQTGGDTYCGEEDGEVKCYTSQSYTLEYDCDVTFTVDPENLIVEADYTGDYGGCSSFFNKHPTP